MNTIHDRKDALHHIICEGSFEDLSIELRSDKSFIIDAAALCPFRYDREVLYSSLSESLQMDFDIAIEFMRRSSYIPWLNKNLYKSHEFILKLIGEVPSSVYYLEAEYVTWDLLVYTARNHPSLLRKLLYAWSCPYEIDSLVILIRECKYLVALFVPDVGEGRVWNEIMTCFSKTHKNDPDFELASYEMASYLLSANFTRDDAYSIICKDPWLYKYLGVCRPGYRGIKDDMEIQWIAKMSDEIYKAEKRWIWSGRRSIRGTTRYDCAFTFV